MSTTGSTTFESGRKEAFALLSYLALLLGLIVFAGAMTSNLLDRHASLIESRDTLARLGRQMRAGTQSGSSNGLAVDASPFLSGKTITVAGAALQERVEAAVKNSGGDVLSSQIDLQGPRAAEGFVGLTETLEIGQADLQPLLYDLEAGTPYLFIETLEVQSPQARGEAEGARMRVVFGVTGQWRDIQ